MGAPLALLAAVFALHVPPPTTHDRLPVFLGDRGPVYFADGTHAPLSDELRVFRRPRTLDDLLPRPLLQQAADWNLDGSTSRLLAPARAVRVWRNGFYARARRVGRVVATARDGSRHVFELFRCEVIDGTDFLGERIVGRPLDPLPDDCG